ncbi:MAG TPA: protealysin inhibitor emfourin [Chloroflexota bacterium]
MRIQFTRTGGFAGIQLTNSVDTAQLPPDQAAALEKLIGDAGFFDLPERLAPAKPVPDRFEYEVTVTSGEQSHTLVVNDAAAPASLKPLLNYLTTLAIVNRKS